MHKAIGTAAGLSLLLFGVTECHMIESSRAFASQESGTQTLSVDPHFGILDNILKPVNFDRIEASIITTQPWLKPEIANRQISNEDLIGVLSSAGFEGYGLRMAWAVVVKESTRKPYAHNQNYHTGDNSYGLFQINMLGGMGPERREKYGLDSNEDLFNPITNARIAFEMSNGGNNWSAWTTYSRAKEIVNQFPG